jgi:hypothetical protein
MQWCVTNNEPYLANLLEQDVPRPAESGRSFPIGSGGPVPSFTSSHYLRAEVSDIDSKL